MSRKRILNFNADEIHIERIQVNHESNIGISNKFDETRAFKRQDDVQQKRITIKEEIVNNSEDEEECFIFADDMEIMQLPDELPYVTTALTLENQNNENSSGILLIGPSDNSPPCAAGSSNDQSEESDRDSAVYVAQCSPMKAYETKTLKGSFTSSQQLPYVLQQPSFASSESVSNKSSDYDSDIFIYPVQEGMQSIERRKIRLQNRESVQRLERNRIQDSDYATLLEMRDADKIIITSVGKKETHPFVCDECSESFELKSQFVMHELSHEKYKFYSFRTNTVKYICVQCKKPYLYSANNKQLNSNMCMPCVIKLRERMSLYNTDKGKENGVKRFLEFSDICGNPKLKEQKQCYSCGRRSDRYFVYGASLLCSQCWQDRTRRGKRKCSPKHMLTPQNYRGRNLACTKCIEKFPFQSEVPHFQCEHAEENPNLIGTHFLLTSFDTSAVNGEEGKDGGFQELEEDWKEIGISACEDEQESNTVILCDKTGEFIDLN